MEIEKFNYTGFVYDLEIAEGESFVAEGMVVHNCTRIPVIERPGETTWQTGREWFAEQSESVQRQMMGAQRFEAWRAGKFDFDDLVTVRKNSVWGDSAQPTPLHKLPH